MAKFTVSRKQRSFLQTAHLWFILPKVKKILGVAALIASTNIAYGQSQWLTNGPLNNTGLPECGLDYRSWYNGRVGVMTIGQPLTTLHLHTGINPTDDNSCEPVKLR